jgi:hypothetical protein
VRDGLDFYVAPPGHKKADLALLLTTSEKGKIDLGIPVGDFRDYSRKEDGTSDTRESAGTNTP